MVGRSGAELSDGRSNAKATGLCARHNDDISVGEVERIGIETQFSYNILAQIAARWRADACMGCASGDSGSAPEGLWL